MDKKKILTVIKELKEKHKRNFKQTFDLIITLKDLDLKKADEQVDYFAQLHYPKGRKISVCALIGPELQAAAKEACDFSVLVDDFDKYAKNPKEVKKLAEKCDFFVAQANIMPKVAAAFGKILGRRGKMPNPKAGCIVPPNANLKALVEKLQKTVRLSAKTSLMIQSIVGKEDSPEDQVVDNILTIYDSVIHHTPKGKNNVNKIFLKLTMSKPLRID
jgi:large subunit ribosomal protein L1